MEHAGILVWTLMEIRRVIEGLWRILLKAMALSDINLEQQTEIDFVNLCHVAAKRHSESHE